MKTTNTIKHDGLFHTTEWDENRIHLETGPIDIASTVEWDEVLWDASITMPSPSPEDYTITWTDAQ
jgi:hypothetical protein